MKSEVYLFRKLFALSAIVFGLIFIELGTGLVFAAGDLPYRGRALGTDLHGRLRTFEEFAEKLQRIILHDEDGGPFSVLPTLRRAPSAGSGAFGDIRRDPSGHLTVLFNLPAARLEELESEDQLAGYCIFYAKLFRIFSDYFTTNVFGRPQLAQSSQKEKLRKKLDGVDAEVLAALNESGYDPREYVFWVTRSILRKGITDEGLLEVLKKFSPSQEARPTQIKHWLAQEAERAVTGFPPPRPLPLDIAVRTHPEMLPSVARANVLDRFTQLGDFSRASGTNQIALLYLLTKHELNASELVEVAAYAGGICIFSDRPNGRLIHRIDGMVKKIGQGGDAETKQKAFWYFLMGNPDRILTVDEQMRLVDEISPPPKLNSLPDFDLTMLHEARFHILQKLQSLLRLTETTILRGSLVEIEESIVRLSVLVAQSVELPPGAEHWLLGQVEKRRAEIWSLWPMGRGEPERWERILAGFSEITQNLNARMSVAAQDKNQRALQLSQDRQRASTIIGELIAKESEQIIEDAKSFLRVALRLTISDVSNALAGRSSERQSPILTPPSAVEKTPVLRLLAEAGQRATPESRVFEIFGELSKTTIPTRLNVHLDETLLRRFISAVFLYGTLEQRAGQNWPSAFGEPERVKAEIRQYLSENGSYLMGGVVLPVVRALLNPDVSITDNVLVAYGVRTEHFLEYLREEHGRETFESAIEVWLTTWENPHFLQRTLFPGNQRANFGGTGSQLWPSGDRKLFLKVMQEVERRIQLEPDKNQAVNACLAVLFRKKHESDMDADLRGAIRLAMENIRLRPLPQALADLKAQYSSLTLEEKSTSLTQHFRKAKTPQEFGQVLFLMRRLNTDLMNQGFRQFDPDLVTLYVEKIASIYEGARVAHDQEFIYGVNWPSLLPGFRKVDDVVSAGAQSIILLYRELLARRDFSHYERFRTFYHWENPKAFRLGLLAALYALEESPHFAGLTLYEKLTVFHHLADRNATVGGTHRPYAAWEKLYIFLGEHRGSDEPLPQDLLAALTQEPTELVVKKIEAVHHSFEIEIPQRLDDALFWLVARTMEQATTSSVTRDRRADILAAGLLDRLDSSHERAENNIRRFLPMEVLDTVDTLKERLRDTSKRKLFRSELDASLRAVIRNTHLYRDYIAILDGLKTLPTASVELQGLVQSRFRHFVTAAFETENYDVLYFDSTRWPGWILENDRQRQAYLHRLRVEAFHDPRLPLMHVARLAHVLVRASGDSRAKRRQEYFSHLRSRIKSREDFFGIIRDPVHLSYATLSINTASPTELAAFFRSLMKENWKMTWEFAQELLAEPGLWAATNGSEMSVFIKQSKNMALHELESDQGKVGYKGPAYEYRLDSSEEFQRLIVERMRRDHTYPANRESEAELFMGLAKRGATGFSDSELRRIFMHPQFTDVEKIRAALSEGLIWDFQVRHEIFEKLHTLDHARNLRLQSIRNQAPAARLVAIREEIQNIFSVFPEESLDRATVLERFSEAIRSTHQEARLIHLAKYDSGSELESAAFKLFIYLNDQLKTLPEKMEFVLFLQGKQNLPAAIRDVVSHGIGASRLLRQFQSFTPQMRSYLLDISVGPTGLMGDKKMEKRLIELVISDAGVHKEKARVLLNAILYALEKTEPYRKSLTLAFLLGHVGRVGGSPGEKLRILLEALDGTGDSLSQIIVQRRLLPEEYLVHIRHTLDNSRTPDRYDVYQQLAEVLEVVDVNDILDFHRIEGAGAARVVIKVKIKDAGIRQRLHRMGFGLVEDDEDGVVVAAKLLRPHFKRSVEREIVKMDYVLEYVERHGTDEFKRLRSPIETVQRLLQLQGDLSLEPKAYAKLVELYADHTGETRRAGFEFVVNKPDLDAMEDSQIALEEFAEGEGLSSLSERLTEEEVAPIFNVIYNKENEILFAQPDVDGFVHFEVDRQRGNARVKFNPGALTQIRIIDYPLFEKIHEQKRTAILKLLGYLHVLREKRLHVIPPTMLARVLNEFRLIVSKPFDLTEQKLEALTRAFRRNLSSFSASPEVTDRSVLELLLDLFAAGESVFMPVDFSVSCYLKALGYAESYAPSQEDFETFLGTKVSGLLGTFDESELTTGDRCAGFLSRVANRLLPRRKIDTRKE